MPGTFLFHAGRLILLLACAAQPTTSAIPRPPGTVITMFDFHSESLEWMVMDSPVVLRGKIQSVTPTELIVEVTERIKGEAQIGGWVKISWAGSLAPITKGADVL